MIKKDTVVGFHYRMCEVDGDGEHGQWLEDSFGSQPVVYLHGYHNIIPGIEIALTGKSEGEQISITLAPDQAYGERQNVPPQRVPIKHLHAAKNKKFRPGEVVVVETSNGPRNMTVVKSGKFNVDVDVNHPYAGKTLYYELEVVSARDATGEELAHGHAHGPGGHHH